MYKRTKLNALKRNLTSTITVSSQLRQRQMGWKRKGKKYVARLESRVKIQELCGSGIRTRAKSHKLALKMKFSRREALWLKWITRNRRKWSQWRKTKKMCTSLFHLWNLQTGRETEKLTKKKTTNQRKNWSGNCKKLKWSPGKGGKRDLHEWAQTTVFSDKKWITFCFFLYIFISLHLN